MFNCKGITETVVLPQANILMKLKTNQQRILSFNGICIPLNYHVFQYFVTEIGKCLYFFSKGILNPAKEAFTIQQRQGMMGLLCPLFAVGLAGIQQAQQPIPVLSKRFP